MNLCARFDISLIQYLIIPTKVFVKSKRTKIYTEKSFNF